MGGKIWFESEEEDILTGKKGGTTFYFTLPYIVPREKKAKDILTIKKEAMGRMLEVLIAEDEEFLELLMRDLIENFAGEIYYARTGDQAVDICLKNPDIDLILWISEDRKWMVLKPPNE